MLSNHKRDGRPKLMLLNPKTRIAKPMRKWKHFPTIVAKKRPPRTPDRYISEFQRVLKSWLSIYPNDICAYSCSIAHAKRDLPKVDIIILLHRRATAAVAASLWTALEGTFDDIANLTIAVTIDKKAFFSIVAKRNVEH